MTGRNAALVIAGLIGFGVFAPDIGARSQAASSPGDGWAIHTGSPNEVWKLNTRTGELYYCITAPAQPKVICSK